MKHNNKLLFFALININIFTYTANKELSKQELENNLKNVMKNYQMQNLDNKTTSSILKMLIDSYFERIDNFPNESGQESFNNAWADADIYAR